ncbi:uncharacterized protein LOC143257412 [Tachypleus tridentatus]|uniref:uncharacterized protein LOC143257412 n=1 Tax=Tachypleus tridentatus TaxID=6853 RepID=UPI003FCEEAD4
MRYCAIFVFLFGSFFIQILGISAASLQKQQTTYDVEKSNHPDIPFEESNQQTEYRINALLPRSQSYTGKQSIYLQKKLSHKNQKEEKCKRCTLSNSGPNAKGPAENLDEVLHSLNTGRYDGGNHTPRRPTDFQDNPNYTSTTIKLFQPWVERLVSPSIATVPNQNMTKGVSQDPSYIKFYSDIFPQAFYKNLDLSDNSRLNKTAISKSDDVSLKRVVPLYRKGTKKGKKYLRQPNERILYLEEPNTFIYPSNSKLKSNSNTQKIPLKGIKPAGTARSSRTKNLMKSLTSSEVKNSSKSKNKVLQNLKQYFTNVPYVFYPRDQLALFITKRGTSPGIVEKISSSVLKRLPNERPKSIRKKRSYQNRSFNQVTESKSSIPDGTEILLDYLISVKRVKRATSTSVNVSQTNPSKNESHFYSALNKSSMSNPRSAFQLFKITDDKQDEAETTFIPSPGPFGHQGFLGFQNYPHFGGFNGRGTPQPPFNDQQPFFGGFQGRSFFPESRREARGPPFPSSNRYHSLPFFRNSEPRSFDHSPLGSGNFEVIRGGIFNEQELSSNYLPYSSHQSQSLGFENSRFPIRNSDSYFDQDSILGFQGFDNFPHFLNNALSEQHNITVSSASQQFTVTVDDLIAED